SRAPSMLRRARAVRAPVWMTVLVATAVGAMNALLPLLFDSLGAGHIGIGAIFLAGAVVAAAGSPLVGRLADRRDRWGIARTAIALSLALTFAMAAIRSVGALAPVAILALALWPMASIPLMTIAAEEAERAGIPVVAAMSSLTIAWALGELIGAPVGSAVAQVGSYAMSLTLLGLVAAAAVAAVTPTVRSALSGGRG